MSRKDKNIQITERERKVDGKLVSELVTERGDVIGTVFEEGDRFKAEVSGGGSLVLSSREEAYGWILREYHLHHG